MVVVALILVAALIARLAYVADVSYHAKNDAGTYNRLGSLVAQTGDYSVGSRPGSGAGGSRGPTAYFPPGFPYFLALVDILDGHQKGGKTAVGPERDAQAVLGTISVGLIGLVALEAFGELVALVALVLAAAYPVFVVLSGTLVAENLMLVFELAAVWTALRARRARYPYLWIAATGLLIGLATLTHENAVTMAIPVLFAIGSTTREARKPVTDPSDAVHSTTIRGTGLHSRLALRRVHDPPWWSVHGRMTGAIALLLATIALTITPWTIRNAVELHHLIPVSDETGITLVGTYNPDSAAFGQLPYKWRFFWTIPQDTQLMKTAGLYTEPALSATLESQALHYIGDHPFSPLDVAFHNTLRMFELEGSFAWQASAYALDIPDTDARVGVVSFWVLCALALGGVLTTLARGAPRWLWWVPVLYALTIVFVNVETPRFREPIDPFLILLAACGIVTTLEWGWRRARSWGVPV